MTLWPWSSGYWYEIFFVNSELLFNNVLYIALFTYLITYLRPWPCTSHIFCCHPIDCCFKQLAMMRYVIGWWYELHFFFKQFHISLQKHLYLHVDWYLINVTLKWIGYMSFVGEIDNNFKRFLSFEYIEYNQIVIKGEASAVFTFTFSSLRN